MKKTELKNILKPLIKQCVREALLEEGVLSNVVSEVVAGLSPLLSENKSYHIQTSQNKETDTEQQLLEQRRREIEEERMLTIKEQKRKILNATGFGDEIFEGVSPITAGGRPDSNSPAGPLSGVASEDPGVDISGIMSLGGHKWNKLI